MLEDVIKTKDVNGKDVSLLYYTIEDKTDDPYYNHYYEIRISHNDKYYNWETYAENYSKKEALLLFDEACVQAEKQYRQEQEQLERQRQDKLPIDVKEDLTGKVFSFKNSYHKREFFRAWKRLVVNVE